MLNPSRREWFGMAGALAPAALAQTKPASQPVPLPPFTAKTERQSGPPPAPLPPGERVGYAIVGLGRLTVEQILPAISQTQKCRLAALASGTPDKMATLARQYGVPGSSLYSYDALDRIADDKSVQAVYVVLPNGLHREYTVRAFKAGKHVLCEKPMANSSAECQEMIRAAEQAKRKLMVAYRIQYEPMNRQVRQWVRTQKHGSVKLIEAVNVQRQGEPDQWRHQKKLAGGGSLPDIGLYCLNTTRYLLGEEPSEVYANIFSTPGDPRFREVEENVTWQMRFPSGILANLMTGYDAHESRRYRVYAQTGWFGMDPAFSYRGLQMQAAHAEGKIEMLERPALEEKNQFALEMDHFAECILEDKQPFTPGEEGLQDHRIMEAIYESARTRQPVRLQSIAKLDAFRGPVPSGNE